MQRFVQRFGHPSASVQSRRKSLFPRRFFIQEQFDPAADEFGNRRAGFAAESFKSFESRRTQEDGRPLECHVRKCSRHNLAFHNGTRVTPTYVCRHKYMLLSTGRRSRVWVIARPHKNDANVRRHKRGRQMKILPALRSEQKRLSLQLTKISAAIQCLNGARHHNGHKMSAAARRHMAEAQRKRWAAAK